MGRVLVVDDDAGVRSVLVELLETLGHDVTEADSGAVALTSVAEHRPDVVCLDLWMDGMPGMEVLDRLRRDHPKLPVIVVTADPLSDTMRDALARGAFGYLPKPFDVPQLKRVLAAALALPRMP